MVKDRALAPLLPRVIIETQGELLLRVLQTGTVSTNVYLRRLHNFCVDMNWLPWPLIPKRQWPVVRFKDKRAITWEEHCRIVAREQSPERKAFYKLAWHLGASQSDLAHLQAEDVDWQARIICFVRMKAVLRGSRLVLISRPSGRSWKKRAKSWKLTRLDVIGFGSDWHWLECWPSVSRSA